MPVNSTQAALVVGSIALLWCIAGDKHDFLRQFNDDDNDANDDALRWRDGTLRRNIKAAMK